MKPIDKLREEIADWQRLDREARETLKITDAILPPLLERLKQLESTQPAGSQESMRPIEREEKTTESDNASSEDAAPVFNGDSIAQVEQALRWKSPQCSLDLERVLAAHGRAFSRGAIGYALRDLEKTGRVHEVEKRGNLKYYAPVANGQNNDAQGAA